MKNYLSSSDLEAKVRGVVDALIDDGKMFTAYDVTKSLRSAGFWVEHRDVRECVHGMFERGEMSGTGYARTVIPIPGKAPAFCYHLYTKDASEYDEMSFGQAVDEDEAPSPIKKVPHAKKDPATLPSIVLCERDSYGRLNIPKIFVDAIGLKRGENAKVYVNGGHLEIVNPERDERKMETPCASYIVNCKGNVRISASVLNMLPAFYTTLDSHLDPTGEFIILQ